MKNKIAALTTLSLITLLSFGKNVFNANAIAIADPVGWDYKYDYDSVSNRIEFTNRVAGSDGTPIGYTQSSGTTYQNDDFRSIYVGDDAVPFRMWLGFGLSTTSWTFSGGYYYPSDYTSYIGSNSTTASSGKFYSLFENTTNTGYLIGFNLSESFSSSLRWNVRYSPSMNMPLGEWWTGDVSEIQLSFTRSTTEITWLYWPPYTNLEVGHASTNTSIYLSGIWFKQQSAIASLNYLEVLNQGFDQGYNDGFIDGQDSAESNVTSRISNLLSQTFAGVRNVFNIKIFDQLTIGSVMLFPLAFGIFTFIFRLIRGGKA